MEGVGMRYKRRLLLLFLAMATPGVFADNVSSSPIKKVSHSINSAMPTQQTNNMLLLMEVMRSNITQMSDLMESHRSMNKTHLNQAARVMQSMSDNMQELSLRMKHGHLDDRSVAMISSNNQHMIDMMQKLQLQLETVRK